MGSSRSGADKSLFELNKKAPESVSGHNIAIDHCLPQGASSIALFDLYRRRFGRTPRRCWVGLGLFIYESAKVRQLVCQDMIIGFQSARDVALERFQYREIP